MKKVKFIAALGTFFAAIFYVLFKQAKEERQNRKIYELEEVAEKATNEKEQAQAVADAIKYADEESVKDDKKYEELREESHGNNLDSFNAGLDLLRK